MLAEELQEKYGISVHVFGLDMLAPDASVKIHNWCQENDFPVDKLINNIGMGGRSDFETCELRELEQMLILNIQTATWLSRLFVERLKKHHRSYIRSEEHTSELQSLMRNSYAVFCLKKKN